MRKEHHYLKCETYYYQETERNAKLFEVRKNDRNYKVGDMVVLKEVVNGTPTGRSLSPREILFVLNGGQYGLDKDYCVLQLTGD